jgi:nucleoside phosphorylase
MPPHTRDAGPSIDPLDLFLLLRAAMDSQATGDLDLARLRAQQPALTADQAWTRAELLVRYLGITEDGAPDVAEGLQALIGSAGPDAIVPRASVEAVIRAARARDVPASHPLTRYEASVERRLGRSVTAVAERASIAETASGESAPGGERRQMDVVNGLDVRPLTRDWPKEILESPAWNQIDSPVPGVPGLPLHDLWINVTLRELFRDSSAAAIDDEENQAWSELSFDMAEAGTTVEEILSQLKSMTVVAGLPGAGKSTLMKWIARYVVSEPECAFGIPVLVSLRQYAKEKARRPALSLFEYFLYARGITEPGDIVRWRSLAAGLLDPPDASSDTPETFIWLLDGWDEVPVETRDLLLPEIAALARYPCIITTRYSGDPLQLPAGKYYELQGLKHGAALELAYRWLKLTGREAYFAGIETALEASMELRRMARSPFLLTLLCALYSRPRGDRRELPRHRGDVLRETLDLVYAQHNADPKQPVKFDRGAREHVATFAFWLLAAAPDAPRFVFDRQDFDDATATSGIFDSLLAPSRLIARPSAETLDYQFLHASFQEFLAARHLAVQPSAIPSGAGLVHDRRWNEVAQFLAAMVAPASEAWTVLWQDAKEAVAELDRYGVLAARVCRLLAAAGVTDGGRQLLGRDLRDELWRILEAHEHILPRDVLDAFVELSPTDLARRILDRKIKWNVCGMMCSWLQLLSVFDLEPLLEDEKYRAVLAEPEVAAFCPRVADWSQTRAPAEAVGAGESGESLQSHLTSRIRAAARKRDLAGLIAALEAAAAGGDADAAYEAAGLLDRFPPGDVARHRLGIATNPAVDPLTRGLAVQQLVEAGDRAACRKLMIVLAGSEVDGPLVRPILANLGGFVLNHTEHRLVLEILRGAADPEARIEAAELLVTTRAANVASSLLDAWEVEREGEVRKALLRAVTGLGDDSILDRLWNVRRDHLDDPDEHGLWLKAVLSGLRLRRHWTSAYRQRQPTDRLTGEVERWVRQQFAEIEHGVSPWLDEVMETVFQFPEIIGSSAMTAATRIAEDSRFRLSTRGTALRSLLRIGGQDVTEYVRKLIARKRRLRSWDLASAACGVLGELAPEALLTTRLAEADFTMARLAFRRGILFMKDQVLDPRSRSMTNSTRSNSTRSISDQSVVLEETGDHASVDVAVVIALDEEWQLFRAHLRRHGCQWHSRRDRKKAFTYHLGTLESDGGQPARLVAIRAAEMGPQRAADIASTLLDRFAGAAVVVIGITGALSDDLKLGDVLIPNQVSAYLENSAAEDTGGDTWQLVRSGKTFTSDAYLLDRARDAAERSSPSHRRWTGNGARRLQRRLGKDDAAKALGLGVTGKAPRIFAGDHHLATGPVLAKSLAFAKWLKGHNRKVAAVEMETAAIYEATETEIQPRRRLAIRGISDFADDRKQLVEREYRGKFREISMLNASDFFLELLKAGVFAKI